MSQNSITNYIIKSTIARKLLAGDSKIKRRRYYLERYCEYGQEKISSNIVLQLLPLMLVLALFYVLGTQNLFFGTVLSDSMEPTFIRGDLVLMQSIFEEPNVGDIVMFSVQRSSDPITHRIVKIDKYGYITTKGDANPKEDNLRMKKGSIRGKAVIIGTKPVIIKGLGATLVSRAGEFTIMKEVTTEGGFRNLFNDFRAIAPSFVILMVIIYFFMIADKANEEKHRFRRKGKDDIK